MDLTVLKKDKENMDVLLDGINSSMINTLRRVSIGNVPVMAIKDVTFSKNTSALYDEIIAHRMGLMPIKTDLKSYGLQNECKCKGAGCARCQTTFVLKVAGPGTVYAKDLKIKDPGITVVHPNLPIVKLLKNQKLEIEGTITLGKGKEHTKYSPCLAYYKAYPQVSVGKDLKNSDVALDSCPVNVFDKKGSNLNIKNEKDCIMCNACVDVADPKGSITVEPNENKFIFTIESWGQLEHKEILEEGLNQFDLKLEEFKKTLKKAK